MLVHVPGQSISQMTLDVKIWSQELASATTSVAARRGARRIWRRILGVAYQDALARQSEAGVSCEVGRIREEEGMSGSVLRVIVRRLYVY